jgi:hypothetical protein
VSILTSIRFDRTRDAPRSLVQKHIPSCPGYWASSDGEIVSDEFVTSIGQVRKPFKPKQQVNDQGYFWVATRYGNKRVSRLVCEAFHGAPPSDIHQAAHLDCDPSNNYEWNLEWQTPAENSNSPITRARAEAAIKARRIRESRLARARYKAAREQRLAA